MDDSFFFYDLETSGFSAKRDRIMQFAGQRTDSNLKAIGDPINFLLRLPPDVLPSPQAIMVTGLSPLEGLKKGISEADFSQIFNQQIALPKTIFVGFNNIRFDDEFIRYLNYRNFYDAYSWHWKDSNSRWDLLDVVRLTRALRPEGITWPTNEEEKPSNRLEHLAAANKLKHVKAHDALADALVTIELAKLIKKKQPKLFAYLLALRQKSELIKLINAEPILIYTSSHYPSEFLHTALVSVLSIDPKSSSALVYDLRYSPEEFLNLSTTELVSRWEYNPDRREPGLPVKTMKLNRCPAVAPLSTLDKASIDRLKLDLEDINSNQLLITKHKQAFVLKLREVIKELDKARDKRLTAGSRFFSADERLYDKFIDPTDSRQFDQARTKAKLSEGYSVEFKDSRLKELYSLYRARNYLNSLSPSETAWWREHVFLKLLDGEDNQFKQYQSELVLLAESAPKSRQALLKDLNKYATSISNEYGAG